MTIGWVSELIALGRLRVIRPIPRSTVTRTSSFSSTVMQCRTSPSSAQPRVEFPVKDLGGSFGNRIQVTSR